MTSAKVHPVDFDHLGKDYANHWVGTLRAIRESSHPVSWNTNYGGFWVLTRYADAQAAASDEAHFSAAKHFDENGNPKNGAMIPPSGPATIPFEIDPPLHGKFRALFAQMLTPSAIAALEPDIRQLVTSCIDSIIEQGHGDLVLDVASVIPAVLTCDMLGVDRTHARRISDLMHKVIYVPVGTPERVEVEKGIGWLAGLIAELVADRRAAPREDGTSRFVHAKIDGVPVTDDQAIAMVMQFIGGGADTTASLVSTALMYLDENREARAWLQEDLSRVPAAIEEFLRFYSTAQYVGRTVKEEVSIGGQVMRPGERVMISWAAANRDPAKFDAPDDMKLDRFAKGGWHMGFGMGAHACVGMNLARLEARITMTEILRRLPDYQVMPGKAVRYGTIGTVNGWVNIPVTFTPGKKA